MSRKYALLPCNGLDKAAGPLAREVALAVVAAQGEELICPVLLHKAPARYARQAEEFPVLVIDGCGTRCASRLAAEHGLKIERRLQVAEAAEAAGFVIEETFTPGPAALEFCQRLARELLPEETTLEGRPEAAEEFLVPVEYYSFTHDKFIFRVPKEGYLFNENDCWARVSGNRARVGVSDYMQQYLSDIIFCETPEMGAEIEQFGEVGAVESTKAVFELVSPVTGKVIAVNEELATKPELVNEDPYERGWIAELELSALDSDRELLIDGAGYLEVVKRKTAGS